MGDTSGEGVRKDAPEYRGLTATETTYIINRKDLRRAAGVGIVGGLLAYFAADQAATAFALIDPRAHDTGMKYWAGGGAAAFTFLCGLFRPESSRKELRSWIEPYL